MLQLDHMLECSMATNAFVEIHMASMDRQMIPIVALPVQAMQPKNVEGNGECQYTKLVRVPHHCCPLKYSLFKL